MNTNISDRNGRALEYCLSSYIIRADNYHLSNESILANSRDEAKFHSLPINLQQSFKSASTRISKWIYKQLDGNQFVSVIRLTDSSSDPSDFLLAGDVKSLRISLKHNHEALKHPRPYSFAQYCDYPKKSTQDLFHRRAMKAIEVDFRARNQKASQFKDCPKVEIDRLYERVCQACDHSLSEWQKNDPYLAERLFNFIVNNGFYKIIVPSDAYSPIKIQDYRNIVQPKTAHWSSLANRLILNFDNSWKIDMRIHTASSRIGETGTQLSLKFDAQKINGAVKEEVI